MSEWVYINAGVPQGTLLGPVGFLLHINDLQTICNTVKYVDDSSIWEVCAANCHDSQLQLAADQACEWTRKNLMQVNSDKTKAMTMTFSRKADPAPPISVDGKDTELVTTFKLLGVVISADLTWGAHVEYLHGKCARRLYLLVLLKRAGVPAADILRIYLAMIRSVLEYADKLESIQRRALRTLCPTPKH